MKITKKTGIIAIVLVAAIALMGFGFAAWSSTLTIGGATKASAKWEVVFTDVANITEDEIKNADETAGATATEVGAASIKENGLTLDLGTITFSMPKGWQKYEVSIKNNGTVDAKLTAITPSAKTSSYTIGGTTYDVIFTGLPDADVIEAGETCKFQVLVKIADFDNTVDFSASSGVQGDNFVITLKYENNAVVVTPEAPTHSTHA